MHHHSHFPQRWATTLLVACLALLALGLPARLVYAAPPHAPAATTVELTATDDIGVVESVPTAYAPGFPYFLLSKRAGGDFDNNFVRFDLSVLPPDAVIEAAQLQLHITIANGAPLDLEVGRPEGDWSETSTPPMNWSNQPTITWGGPVTTVTSSGVVQWPVKALVTDWQNGTRPNYGLVLHGINGSGGTVEADTKDGSGVPPKLVITYSLPADDGKPHPDLGDAPDSSNHHGINNTAYALGNVAGQFPTVYNVPAGQVAGPLHANQSMEAWLGDFLSREAEADLGPDQDAPRNNILRNTATGAVGDVADNDRGDDGWRNRSVAFVDCQRTVLDVRVSKSPVATRKFMFLNVWFDGNRDGDWADSGQCPADESGPAQPGYEWIVQNYIIDMTTIPAGGTRDFAVLTEKLRNANPNLPHWMRFTLSEERAVQPGGAQLPDGRGPHPADARNRFEFGETEDIFQKPAPAGENGTLEIQKRVVTNGEPVEWIDYVTYEIRLRHRGGSQPLQARLRDVLPYPLIVYPTIDGSGIHYVTVVSATGGATPLQAQLDVIPPSGSTPPEQVVKWQGSLAPNAEIVFSFQVRVIALCEPNQQTMQFTNIAEAKAQNGPDVSASATFTAKCIDYDEHNIDIQVGGLLTPTLDLADLKHVPWQAEVWNKHPVSVTLAFFQAPNNSQATASELSQPRFLDRITLSPDAKQVVNFTLRMEDETSDELALAPDYLASGKIAFCILPGEESTCPEAQKYPQLHGQIPFTVTVHPNDLGDAPDSSNHAGVAMAAYPNVPANFPSVFDPATGQPQGTRHAYPRPFHLGQRVSREAEADLGPDQDPQNNLVPAANDPDNDRGDDGTNLALWSLNNCQTTNLPVQVAIAPPALNYFQQLGTPAYLNIWLDSNRDGDWADAAQCGQNPAPEHIVIDFPVNVAGLGAGLHNLNVPTGLVPWQVTDKPAWVRITLSERPANKTLQAGNLHYGDGRGYAQPFVTGETEDYYYRPLAASGGPDLAVQMSASSSQATTQGLGVQAASSDKLGNFEIQMFKIDYSNIGTTRVDGALLEFQIPEKLHGLHPVIVKGTGVTQESISFNFDKLSLVLPHIEQNALGSVVLGWYGCITCTVANQVAAANTAVDYTASVKITVNGDVDASNNNASATARGLLSSPIIGAFMDYTDDSCMDRSLYGPVVTNKATVELRGKAAPNQIIAILIGLLRVATVTSDANGNFIYSTNPGQGVRWIHAEYANQVNAASTAIVSPRDVASGQATGVILKSDPSLPFDPMSVCFVDSRNRSYALPTLGYSFGASQAGSWFRQGESYRISLNGQTGNLNQYFKVTFEDILISSLLDTDGDGTYTGTATMPSTLEAASVKATGQLRLIVGDERSESTFSADLATANDGVISDRITGQPLANANVSALLAQTASDGSIFYSGWGQDQSGQPNPQVTGADGKYSYSASSGIYRLDVAASGYQPYRTADMDASIASIAPNIALAPVINEATTQTIYMTENGFVPANATVTPGSVVEFVNLDLSDHASRNSSWDSGLLAPGQSFKIKLTSAGSYSYGDSAGLLNQATIVVGQSTTSARLLFLPVVVR
jgi:plastocyanin